MKIQYIFLAIITSLMALVSCSDDDKVQLGSPDTYVKPVLTQEMPQGFVIDAETVLTDTVGVWKWNKADYGVNSPVLYTIETSLDANFTDPKTLTTTYDNNFYVTYDEINKAALEYVTESKEVLIYFRIKSHLGTTEVGTVFYTDAVSVNFTCYVAYPKEVYMIGQDFGNWTWTDAGVVEMTPVNGNAGKFWCVRYFNAGNGFKWAPVRDWVDDFNSLGTNVGYTIDGGNAVVATSGFYSVLVDYTTKTITIEPAMVYGMGDAFGGWNAGQYPFVANGNVMELTTSADGELRIYAASSAVNVDWWQMEFVIRDGKIVYRGNGEDQHPRVPVTAGQKITLNFNAGTGTIQ